jgi:hypothetical protein
MLEVLEPRRLLSLTSMDHHQLVYDSDFVDVNNVTGATWLADANLAASQTFNVAGINKDGSMTWETALNWVAAMNEYDNGPGKPVGWLGHSNWTLPLTPNLDPNGTIYNKTVNADFGYDCDLGAMGHLFYDEFHGVAGESVTDIHNPATALFNHFQPFLYWGGVLPGPGRPLPVSFTFASGFLGTTNSNDFLYAIPEFPSDPSDVPQPATANNEISLQTISSTPMLTVTADKAVVHDATLNINWLADADLARKNPFGIVVESNIDPRGISINPDGTMNYPTAVKWIDTMNAEDYLGHNNWRLPDSNVNGAGYYHDDTLVTDQFYSEMGVLYYTELGSQAGSTILRTHDPSASLFHDFQPGIYWSETSNNDLSGNNGHRTFAFGNGYEGGNYDADQWFVIPVFDGNLLTVTNTNDSGPGSLRAAVAAANPGDTIEFSAALRGKTITLQSTIDISEQLYIVGLGASKLAISGNNDVSLFDIEPGGNGADISSLTMENGESQEGGAILDDGASMILNSDVFKHDQAVGATPGADAQGGAVAVLGESTSGMTVTIMACQFNNDTAKATAGGAGQGGAIYVDAETSSGFSFSVNMDTTFTSDSASGGGGQNSGIAGGVGDGGALALFAGQASAPIFSLAHDSFSGCTVSGGQGGTGALDVTGQEGGNAKGGAIYYSDNAAMTPTLSILHSTFKSNSSVGGTGASGKSPGGNGAAGGLGAGGALFVDLRNSADSGVTISGDTLSHNQAQGGNGGAGALSTQVGGTGAAGGTADGGAVDVQIAGSAASTNLMIVDTDMEDNTAKAGSGGAGGSGLIGGNGGNGQTASGGALFLNSPGTTLTDTWTLDSATILHNASQSGAGGKGGAGRHGGIGGDAPGSLGGGVADEFAGTLDILSGSIMHNLVEDNLAGAAGPGLTPGTKGAKFEGSGGGLYVDSSATANATASTKIIGNLADFGPNVSGTLGLILAT